MSGANAFFFRPMEETEGIVVLEAFASHQHVVLCDIPVYEVAGLMTTLPHLGITWTNL